MKRMFIFHNYEDLHKILGPFNVRFTEDEDELQRAFIDRDQALAREEFLGNIPTSNLVEMYIKRASKEGPGTNGNDWVFENAWCAPLSREQAVRKYFESIGGYR